MSDPNGHWHSTVTASHAPTRKLFDFNDWRSPQASIQPWKH